MIGLHAALYDTTLPLSLRSHLRPEQRFDSVDSLRRQLVADREATVDFFSTKQ
ncbi:MAG: riboflavin kinase [Muribaculaceae bacterium]|nr:riboflavin kinase [Muribaculaceae bacterium]